MFRLLRATPALGRVFEDDEERPGSNRVVVLSHNGWQQRFAGDTDVIGRSLMLDDAPHTVLGVMPPGFYFPDRSIELWTPLSITIPNQQPGQVMIMAFQGLARIRRGVSLEQAVAEGQTVVQRIQSGRFGPMAQMEAPTLSLVPLQEEMVGESRPALLALLATVGFVLLIAAANLANLLLARGAARTRELALRAALGADPGRLIRQLLTESTLLAVAGGAVGLLAAAWVIDLLPAIAPSDIPRLDDIALDRRVLGFALALSLVTGLLFGLAPALQSARVNLVQSLNEGSTHSSGGFRLLRGNRTRSVLAVTEIALALVLLIGAGLLIRSFATLIDVDAGYDPANVLTTTLHLPSTRYDADTRSAFIAQLLERVEQAPDVEAAGIVAFLPLTAGEARVIIGPSGRAAATRVEDRASARPQTVSAGYFQAMGMRLVAGRWLTPADEASGANVVLVNEAFAKEVMSTDDAVGQQITLGPGAPPEIIGVVGDVRHTGLDSAPVPEFYRSYRAADSNVRRGAVNLAIRTTGDPTALIPFLREAVLELDPSLPLADVATMEARLANSVAGPRFYALFVGLFAVLALTLASVGIYGILSYLVLQRRVEIGVRMALGAPRTSILAMVLRQGAWLTGLGLLIGLAMAFGVTRLLSSLLFGVTATDPVIFVIVPVVLSVVAFLACYVPARRATHVDPMVALRCE